jgi:ubiquitin carboxyl-terminal hydrolase 4/11/15
VYELTEFLISNQFLVDINDKNALGTGGKLIASYAELLKDLWEGSERYVSPWHLKGVISKVAS